MKRWQVIMVLLLVLAGSAAVNADMRVLAHYELDRGVNQVTYTVGLETLRSVVGDNHTLQRQAEPRFIASAPPHLAGRGALQFDGDKDMYSKAGA